MEMIFFVIFIFLYNIFIFFTCFQLLSNLTAATASGTAAAATTIATSCCETGRPIMTDPHTGQTVCSCQYNSSLLSYSRVAAGLPDGVYPTAYATQGYVPFGTDPSAFYSPLVGLTIIPRIVCFHVSRS